MSDIVERLRGRLERVHDAGGVGYGATDALCDEAADEIERLRAREETANVWRTGYRNDALEEAAKVATSFLVGDPTNDVPLRNPMAHEIAAAIRALKGGEPQ